MFNESDFQLPLEKQLRLQVIKSEIEECTDINALKEQLLPCAEMLMKYQHLLAKSVEVNLMNYLGYVEPIE